MIRFQSDSDFIASLDKAQREYFTNRFAELQEQLQAALRDLSRGLGTIGGLHSDAMTVRLQEMETPARHSKRRAHRQQS